MDRMRESMFSILHDINNKSFLDLFTGSGCIGIEAASRGASPVHLVEKDIKKKPVILENIAMVESPIRLFSLPVEKYFKICRDQYNIIHMDPPFNYQNKKKLLELVSFSGILKEDGILMMHYPAGEKFPEIIGNLRFKDLRKYGGSELIFYSFSNP